MRQIFACVLALLTACGGGGGSNSGTAPPAPSSSSISGRVASPNGSALAGVQLVLSGSGSGTKVSDADGMYEFSSLSAGTYVVTPTAAGAQFTPPAMSVMVQSQTASTANFSRAPQSYPSTQLITDYMATLHSQSLSQFVANENALSSSLGSQGLFASGNHYAQSGQDYVASVQGFVNSSLAFVRLQSQTRAIDSGAVSVLLSTYATQDAAYAVTYYQAVPWGLTGSALATFTTGINQSTDDIYTLAALQIR